MRRNGRAHKEMEERALKALCIISIQLSAGAAAFAVERVESHLLPANLDYHRNGKCNPVSIHMPPSRHSAVYGNKLSPRPSDMPLSQGEYAICFAYATADMISQRIGEEISALDVATKFYFANPSRLALSPDRDLQSHVQRMENYRREIAESRAATETSFEDNPAHLPYVDKLEGGEEDIAALLYNIGGLCIDPDLPSYDGFRHFEAYLSVMRKLTKLFPSVHFSRARLAGAAPAFRSPRTDEFNASWLDRVERRCHRRPLPVPLIPISYRVAKNEAAFQQLLEENRPPRAAQIARMFSMIDYALDHDRAPIVGYSWYVLESAAPEDFDPVADHASVIIARRRSGGTCQYRVQDNTGEYCARMRPGIRERCELGRIWLTKEELKRTLYSVTFLR